MCGSIQSQGLPKTEVWMPIWMKGEATTGTCLMCCEKGTTKQEMQERSLDKLQETGGENLLPCFFWLHSFESLGWAETSSLADSTSPETELSLSAVVTLSCGKYTICNLPQDCTYFICFPFLSQGIWKHAVCPYSLKALCTSLCKGSQKPMYHTLERQRENWGRDAFFSKADR